MSLGDTPGILLAWASVSGCIVVSFIADGGSFQFVFLRHRVRQEAQGQNGADHQGNQQNPEAGLTVI